MPLLIRSGIFLLSYDLLTELANQRSRTAIWQTGADIHLKGSFTRLPPSSKEQTILIYLPAEASQRRKKLFAEQVSFKLLLGSQANAIFGRDIPSGKRGRYI